MQTYQHYVASYQQQQQQQQPLPPVQHSHGALPPTPTLHAPTNHSHTQLPLAPRPLHGPRSPATAFSSAGAGVGAGAGPNVSPQPYNNNNNSNSRPSSPALGAPGSRPGSRLSHSRQSSYERSGLANELGGGVGGGTFDPAAAASLFVPGYDMQQPPPQLQHYDASAADMHMHMPPGQGGNYAPIGSGTGTGTGVSMGMAGDHHQYQYQYQSQDPLGMSEKAAGKQRMVVDPPLPTSDVYLGFPDDRSDGGRSGIDEGGGGGGGGSPHGRFLQPPENDTANEYYNDEPGGEAGGGGSDGININSARPPLRWRMEPRYVYDAAAERTRERIRRGMVGVRHGVVGNEVVGIISPGIEV